MGREPSWKQHQNKSKLKNIVAVFITVTLLFAIANGIAKGFSLKNSISNSKWDSKSSFALALDSINPAVFIYQPESKNLIVLALGGETLYETGSFNKPLEKLSSVIEKSGADLTAALSATYGTKISNFVKLKKNGEIDEQQAEKMFANFASITTPTKILLGGYNDNLSSTNITRIDAFKLWWQLKGLSVNTLEFTDLSAYREEIIDSNNDRVLGADTASLQRIISEYMDNIEVVKERQSIIITNNSGNKKSSILAASFVESVGGNVIDVTNGENKLSETNILASDKNSYTAKYLANIFDCDITEAKNLDESENIMVIIGADFAGRYFE